MKKLLLILSIFVLFGREPDEPYVQECEINNTAYCTVINQSRLTIVVDIVYEDDIEYYNDGYLTNFRKINDNDTRILKPGASTTYEVISGVDIFKCHSINNGVWKVGKEYPIDKCDNVTLPPFITI